MVSFRMHETKYINSVTVSKSHNVWTVDDDDGRLLTSRTREDVTAIVQSVDPGSGLER